MQHVVRSSSFHRIFPRSARAMATSTRTYADAIDALNTLQTPFAILEARRRAGVRTDVAAFRAMPDYLARLGYSLADLDRLNVVHVAGTKGKGSTCAFVASILAHHGVARGIPRRIGLFTSPHLVAVRERLRLDGAPVSETLFARYFFQVWDRLGTAAATAGDDPEEMPPRPAYARFLTLLSYHVFLAEGVDAAVYETGVGGELDATNIVERPLAAGIATLGLDHLQALGPTLDRIAWHKAGIMKTGRPAFAVGGQPAIAEQVLRDRAEEKGAPLTLLPVDPRLDGVAIRPDALFQKKNASLAIALAETALATLDPGFVRDPARLPREFVDGLEQVVWRGRCEVKVEGRVVWHIDGAHTADSVKMAGRWFNEESASRTGPRALIFNQQGRSEAIDFLEGLHKVTRDAEGRSFGHVVFCTNTTFAKTGYKRDFVNLQQDPDAVAKLSVQRAFAETWSAIDPAAKVSVAASIEEAVDVVRALSAGLGEGETVQGFITGSLHLVGGALAVLEGVDAL